MLSSARKKIDQIDEIKMQSSASSLKRKQHQQLMTSFKSLPKLPYQSNSAQIKKEDISEAYDLSKPRRREAER